MTTHDTLPGFLRCDWDRTATVPRMPADAADPRWESLVGEALHHGVTPLLCRVLAGLPADCVPEAIREAAATHLAQFAADHVVAVTELQHVLATLAAEAIPALAFKGPALGLLAHASATVRPLRDLDVVVAPQDVPRAIAALVAHGYGLQERFPPAVLRAWCRDHGQVTLDALHRLPIDLHGLLAPRTLAVDLDIAGMWARARPLASPYHAMRTFALEDTLLAICLHGTKEKWWRLLWVADVAALLSRHPALDWDALYARAAAAGMANMLGTGLALADTLFAAALPADIARRLRRDRRCLQLAEASHVLLAAGTGESGSVYRLSRYHWHAHQRTADRLRYAWRTLLTPGDRHYRMVQLPESLVAGYVAIKVMHDYALAPAWSVAKRVLRSPRKVAEAQP